jgi:glucose/arabinose dehydrogenase
MRTTAVLSRSLAAIAATVIAAACANAGQGTSVERPTTAPSPTGSSSPAPTTDPRIKLASGFTSNTIASVSGARELVGLPNGDLLVGTSGDTLAIVPNAEAAGQAASARTFITLPDAPAQGIALSPDHAWIYAATEYNVYRIPYHSGDRSEPDSSAQHIASVRTGPISPGSDGDVHITSSVAATASTVYVGVGSSCNACVEVDPTRATVQAMATDGSGMHTLATRIRNAIALAIDPATGALWAGGAGQDKIQYAHPYEFMDAVTLRSGSPIDYGWPDCEENRHAYTPGADCSKVAVPIVEFPAYATHVGAAFYPSGITGTYKFPASFAGALFVASHGSWHCCPSTPPDVAVVAMHGDAPSTPVDWADPTKQWTEFMWGFGSTSSTGYIGRPTGVAIGSQGSLFVADDANGVIYRVRPSSSR